MLFTNQKELAKKYNLNNKYFAPIEGNNVIRLVSEFVDFGSHYNPVTKKSSICIGKTKGCLGCKAGLNLSVKFLGYVIDRADGKIKTYKMPYAVSGAIDKLSQSAEYQFDGLPPYDIIINRVGKEKDTKYAIMASRKDTELTEVIK